MPVFIIMFGPPGSGKSSSLEMYLKQYLPHLKPSDIPQYNVDDFVYDNPQYKEEAAQLKVRDEDSLRTLFGKYKANAHKRFRHTVLAALKARSHVAIDVAGRNVDWFSMYVDVVNSEKYDVHIVYPFVNNVKELMTRIAKRFETKGQTPLPKHLVKQAMENAPITFKTLVHTFMNRLVRIAIIDTSAYSFYNGRTLFMYDLAEDTCSIMGFKLSPCRIKTSSK